MNKFYAMQNNENEVLLTYNCNVKKLSCCKQN